MLINVVEYVVNEQFNDFARKFGLKCSCSQCKSDIMAIALNGLPAKYVASETGEVLVKSQYLNQQLLLDIDRELTRAAMIVGEKPRHP